MAVDVFAHRALWAARRHAGGHRRGGDGALDIAGQALGKPVCELIWRSFATTRERAEIKTHVTPYATIYPPGETLDEMQARFETAVQRGFRAMKLEEWPGAFGHGSLETDIAIARRAREVIGPERDLLIDMQNGWSEVGRAVATIRALEPFNIFFIEAPLPPDNLDAYARLADTVDTRIAAGDWGFTSRFEFEELMVRGHVDVVQPSSVRSGGISEILKIAEAAYRRGLLCIPHAWSHMVGVAAEVHMAAVTPNMPYFEYPIAVPDSPIVSELLDPPLVPGADGRIEVPRRPGLGVRLNEETLKRFRVDPH